MKRASRFLATAFILLTFLFNGPGAHAAALEALSVHATRNLKMDPAGRVVDLTFNQDLSVTAPWDRFRFGLDIVQPLTRDAGAFLSDLTGDDIPDLIMPSFSGETLFFPGLAGQPRRFGDGAYLKKTTSSLADDPYNSDFGGQWITGDTADLDGDGKKEVVIGNRIYRNAGTTTQPLLQYSYQLSAGEFILDPSASIGDLNGDGKPDVIMDGYIFWNHSTPGTFSFTNQSLGSPAVTQAALGDLNGDGRLDLAVPAGFYINTGTAQVPGFNFSSPTPWNKTGGPSWMKASDQPSHVFLIDMDHNGTLDAYISNTSAVLWQVLFYRNTGSAAAPQFQYEGPVVAASSPLNNFYRGSILPSFSGKRAYTAAGDVDQNGRPEILLSPGQESEDGMSFDNSTLLWNFAPISGAQAAPSFSYQDLYTYPAMDKITNDCGVSVWDPKDALCQPPVGLSGWADLTGDGLADALVSGFGYDQAYNIIYPMHLRARSGTWPFSLGEISVVHSSPSNALATAWGMAVFDLDRDGKKDVVAGSTDGRLLYYRNLGASGSLNLADPVVLSNNGAAIDVGDESWPTTFDLDGDGDLDLLVANSEGVIRKVINVTPGNPQGFAAGDPLGAAEQNPVDTTHVLSSAVSPALATMDVDSDGLQDVVMGDASGRVWWLRNVGSSSNPSFSLRPFPVTRTAAAFMEKLNARTVRLYFALPTVAGETLVSFSAVPTSGLPLSGEVVVTDPAYQYIPWVTRP